MAKKITNILNLDAVEHEPIKRTVTSFLNKEVRESALYVVKTRACPNVMDGLRVGARKILWAGMNGTLKTGKKDKMMSLIGESFAMSFNHGDASLKNTIEQLGAKHLFENSPINVIGQTSDLRTTDVDTASRYLKTQLDMKNIQIFKHDLELLENSVEDGLKYEPKFFLPIIPVGLLIRTNSPGFGYSYRGFSHSLKDVINATIISLTHGTCEGVEIKPHINEIKPENIVYNHAVNSYYNVGTYSIAGNVLTITDLPFNISIKQYEKHLKQLVENNVILSYQNLTQHGKIRFTCTFISSVKLDALYSRKWIFYKMMKLYTKIMKNTYNLMDINGKAIVHFQSTNEYVDGFVKRRLKFYEKRKTVTVKKLSDRIEMMSDRIKFIQLILDGKLIINNRKIDDIKKDCVKFEVSTDGLQLAISRLTLEEINKSKKEIESCKTLMQYTIETSIDEMYINDLVEMYEEFVEPLITPKC